MKRKRKKKPLVIAMALISVLLVVSLVVIYLDKGSLGEYETKLADLQYIVDANTVQTYVATRDIVAGEPIYSSAEVDGETVTEEAVNVSLQEGMSSLAEEFFVTADDMGYQALVDIKAGTQIMKHAVAKMEISTDLREHEISVAHLMTDQMEHDCIDVRIMFPDGSDYVVLPKKYVNNLHLDNCVFYSHLNESEILTLSSAIVDAYLTTGAYIYTTRYVESSIQDAAIPNYPVRSSTLSLMQSDPNILEVATECLNVQARMDLSTRLSLLSEDQLDAVAEGHGIADTAKGTVLQERLNEEEAAATEGEGAEEITDFDIEDDGTYQGTNVLEGGIS